MKHYFNIDLFLHHIALDTTILQVNGLHDTPLHYIEHYYTITCTESKSTVHQGDCSLLVSVHFLSSCTMVATPSQALDAPPPTVSLEAVMGLYLVRKGRLQ